VVPEKTGRFLWTSRNRRVIHTVPTYTVDLNSAALSPDGIDPGDGKNSACSLDHPVVTGRIVERATRKKAAHCASPRTCALVCSAQTARTLATTSITRRGTSNC